MAEYALPAMLVGLVALGGFTALLNSGNFAQTGALSQYGGELTTQDNQGRTLVQTRVLGKNPNLQTYTFTLANGRTITIPNMPQSVANNIEVDGGQGTTEVLLAALENLRQQLVAEGLVTEADSQAIKDLANVGHNFGRSQGFLEQAALGCGKDKACFLQKVNETNEWRGLEYASAGSSVFGTNQIVAALPQVTEAQWAMMEALQPGFRVSTHHDPSYNFTETNVRFGSDILQFLEAYSKVNALPVEPGVKGLLGKLSSNILSLARGAGNATVETANMVSITEIEAGAKPTDAGEWAAVLPEDFIKNHARQFGSIQSGGGRDMFVSGQTHANATGICVTGQGSDSGQICR